MLFSWKDKAGKLVFFTAALAVPPEVLNKVLENAENPVSKEVLRERREGRETVIRADFINILVFLKMPACIISVSDDNNQQQGREEGEVERINNTQPSNVAIPLFVRAAEPEQE